MSTVNFGNAPPEISTVPVCTASPLARITAPVMMPVFENVMFVVETALSSGNAPATSGDIASVRLYWARSVYGSSGIRRLLPSVAMVLIENRPSAPAVTLNAR
jgi:hypothetical protein